jgi:hypothetical protein
VTSDWVKTTGSMPRNSRTATGCGEAVGDGMVVAVGDGMVVAVGDAGSGVELELVAQPATTMTAARPVSSRSPTRRSCISYAS